MKDLHEILGKALVMVHSRMARAPNWQLLHSIEAQLRAMQDDVRNGLRPSEEKKKSINIGVVAVREFEADDPEFADVLTSAAYWYKKL
jgi:hypothetical protein